MKHFYQDIGEDWFSYPNLYKRIIDSSPDGAHIVEVGSWKGRSAAFMAIEIINSNKNIKFDCVDTWKGSIEHETYDVITEEKLYNVFLSNIEPIKHIITPVRMTSIEASKLYEDNSLNFVFIDASHEYGDVKEDILAWLPKVKIGGILAGHDYNIFEGVTKAVDEIFNINDLEISEYCYIYKKLKIKNMKIDNLMFDLGIKHNTDKITHHRYDRIYPNFLNHLQNNTLKLFEIGYGEGESFKMWQEYFPNGSIFCMDIDKEFISDRGGVYKGDQSNADDLQKMINLIGECDVIIDDGSHVAQHQFDTFNFLFEKMLCDGGVYIIEDIECTYWHSSIEVYGYKTGELNILDTFINIPSKINSEFSKIKNNQNISSITYSKNCIIITKKTLEEINENNNPYRFEYKL